MSLLRTLGAALLAVPLATAVGQSTSEHDPPAAATSDSGSQHRLVWVAGATAAGAAVFTSFVRLSGSRAADLRSSLAIPGSPVPSRYTDGSLAGTGPSPSQNSPASDSPADNSGDNARDSTYAAIGDGPGTSIFDIAIPPPPNEVLQHSTSSDSPPPPPPEPEGPLTVVIVAPEPGMVSLLGTGLVALVPMVRRRRSHH